MRLAALTIGSLVLAATTVAGNAAPLAPSAAGASQATLIPVAEGCGPGWHRTYWGECIPNRAVRMYRHRPRDYIVEETWEEEDY